MNIIIHSATRKDVELIFEAYYNYLGHYTPIENKTVDALLNKTASLAKIDIPKQPHHWGKVSEVLRNHEYLGYYPHYDTTINAAHLAKKAEKFTHYLGII